jgi:undecaprenol kinase
MIRSIFHRFSHPVRGIIYALSHDRSVRNQCISGSILIGICLMFANPLTNLELLFLLLGWILVMITELQNSAIEAALDKLHPERHDAIKLSKDMAAGAVLCAGVFFYLIIAIIFFSRFG